MNSKIDRDAIRRRRVRVRIGKNANRSPGSHPVKRAVLRTLLVLGTLISVLVVALWGVCAVVFWGPSTSARDKLVTSTMEMSVGYIIPHLFFSSETIDAIVAANQVQTVYQETDPNLVVIDTDDKDDGESKEEKDEWADYPDGIRIENVKGDTYRGYVMLIRDPSRVYVAVSSDFKSGQPGLRIDAAVAREGAVAAINGGAFPDDGSTNTGYEPLGLTYSNGTRYWGNDYVTYEGVMGFDENNVLIVGNMTGKRADELGIRDCVCFGPLLVVNGEPATMTGDNGSLNPRTAIGQRADGTVIFLCVDGRMPQSLGASYADLVNIMVEFGAVNAANLDGGSSTHMVYNGEHINVSSSLYGPRRMPTFFMVRPLEDGK